MTPVDNIFNNIEDLLEYGDMENCHYSYPQSISKEYNIINKTEKFLESTKSWNCFPLIQKTWIAFKTPFCESHIEITKTGEFTLEEDGYGQENLFKDIGSRHSSEFQHQANMVNSAPPEYPAPPIATVTADIIK